MIAHVMSDLHLSSLSEQSLSNFWKKLQNQIKQDSPKIAIIAGDLNENDEEVYEEDLINIVNQFANLYDRIFFVAGNHDYWNSCITDRRNFFLSINGKNPKAVFLDYDRPFQDETLCLNGGTLWFPKPQPKKSWVDYKKVRGYIEGEHTKFISSDKNAPIFISHHFPTEESIHKQWEFSKMNMFFHAKMDETLSGWSQKGCLPRLWIHGHTHNPMDYVSKWGFRVYCNPLGLECENLNPEFWSKIKLDISPYLGGQNAR